MRHVAYLIAIFLVAFPLCAQRLILIHITQFEAAVGLHCCDYEPALDFFPQGQAELVYGLDDGEDKVHFGNITLHAPGGLPFVLLERLDPLIEHVDCSGGDGRMAVAFKSGDALQRALAAWGFVNHHEEHTFLLITNHDGCSPNDQRELHI